MKCARTSGNENNSIYHLNIRLLIGCGASLGIESSNVIEAGFTLCASSGTARNGRLYNENGAWCSKTGSTMEYIQVDLKNFALIRGVATQGHPSEMWWTKEFAIMYSFDNQTWQKFGDSVDSRAWKVFRVFFSFFKLL